MNKLEEKIALITGETSGIGLVTAKAFVNKGAYTFITGRGAGVGCGGKESADRVPLDIGVHLSGSPIGVTHLLRS